MRITPLDARKQEFPKAFRGYDCDEVRAFLNTVADEYEAVLVDNKQLREHLMAREDKIRELMAAVEAGPAPTPAPEVAATPDPAPTPDPSALPAAPSAPVGPDLQEIRAAAAREGDRIVHAAQVKAHQIIAECRARTEGMRRELAGLHQEKEAYLARYRALADAQIQFVETHRTEFQDLDGRLMSVINGVLGGVGVAAVPLPPSGYDSPWCAPRPQAAPAPGPGPVPPGPAWYGGIPDAALGGGGPAPGVDVWRDYQTPPPPPVGVAPAGNATADDEGVKAGDPARRT